MKTFHKDSFALAKNKLALHAKVDEMEQFYQEKMKYLDQLQEKIAKSLTMVKILKRVV